MGSWGHGSPHAMQAQYMYMIPQYLNLYPLVPVMTLNRIAMQQDLACETQHAKYRQGSAIMDLLTR